MTSDNVKSQRKIKTDLIAFITAAVIMPAIVAISMTVMVVGIAGPIGALIKLIGYIFGYNMTVSIFDLGGIYMPPAFGLLLSVAVGKVLYVIGYEMMKASVRFLKYISGHKYD